MNDWEENPDANMRDDNGDFKLKKDRTPRKKSGRPQGSSGRGYNYHSETKAKIDARKTVRKKEKRLAQVRTKLENYKRSLDTSKSTLNKIEGKEAKSEGKITTETADLPKALRTVAEENVIFRPNDGPQTDFLAALRLMFCMVVRLVEARAMRCWLIHFVLLIGPRIGL